MKKLLRFFFLIVLCLTAFTAKSAFVVDGITYNVLSETDKTVEVASNNSAYTGDIVIPATVTKDGVEYKVTKIGNSAFYYCYTITSMSLPEGIVEIGESAFEVCMRIKNLTIPESVTKIESSDTQIIRLVVSENDKELRISYEN